MAAIALALAGRQSAVLHPHRAPLLSSVLVCSSSTRQYSAGPRGSHPKPSTCRPSAVQACSRCTGRFPSQQMEWRRGSETAPRACLHLTRPLPAGWQHPARSQPAQLQPSTARSNHAPQGQASWSHAATASHARPVRRSDANRVGCCSRHAPRLLEPLCMVGPLSQQRSWQLVCSAR